MALPGIVIQIGADTKNAVDGIAQVNGALGDSLSSHQKFKASVDKAFVPAIAVLGGMSAAGMEFAKTAAEDEAAAAKLAVALKNTTGATTDQVKATEDWISKQTLATGIADDQIRPALARLVSSTKDIGEAQKMTNLAMEIATSKNLDLTTVSNALAKANDGQFAALKKLGITMGDAATNAAAAVVEQKKLTKAQAEASFALEMYGPKSKEYAKAVEKVEIQQGKLNNATAEGVDWLTELGNTFGGTLTADAATAEGQMRRTATAFAEAKETLGYALLPALEAVTGALRGLVPLLTENEGAVKAIVVVVGAAAAGIVVLKGVITAVEVATKVWTGTQWLLNAALEANPIGIVIVAVAALVAAIVVAYNKVDWFKRGVDTAWEAIKKAFTIGVDTVKGLWDGLMSSLDAIGRFFTIGSQIVDGIRAGIVSAWNGLVSWFSNKIADLASMAANVLGIASPSKVFADIGRNIVAGLEQGLAGMTSVNANLLNGTTQLVAALPTSSTGTTAAQARPVSVNVTEDQIARAIANLLMRSDLRNGRTIAVV